MPESYLVNIAIGPVQEFIASARRSRDLWFSSWLMSELAKTAALRLIDEPGHDISCLIFPAPEPATKEVLAAKSFNVPNKLMARVTTPPETLCPQLHEAMKQRVLDLRDEVNAFKFLAVLDQERAEAQLSEFFEFTWAAVPISEQPSGSEYMTARQTVEALLTARKNTRNFTKVSWGQPRPKSSLDGERESVIAEAEYPKPNANREERLQIVQKLRRKYGLRDVGERLCGVGLLKRKGNRGEESGFFSTSHLAATPLISQLQDKHRAKLAEYIGFLENGCNLTVEEFADAKGGVPYPVNDVFGDMDGRLLFADRLPELLNLETDNLIVKDARGKLRAFLDEALGKGQTPLAYYAILQADGDGMGALIKAQTTIEAHQNLSRSLSGFAGQVKTIVEAHLGSLIYSGGDDVLAFLPLHRLIECAQELRSKFKAALSDIADQSNVEVSLSTGIAIAHHLDPLTDALKLANDAEQAAKSLPGKDALAIFVGKRSGETTETCDKWERLDERLQRFTVLHRLDAIPDGVAYELRSLADTLDHIPEAARCEAIRILKRKQPRQGAQKKLADSVRAKFVKLIEVEMLPLTELACELITARLLADATAQANMAAQTLPGAEDANEEVLQ